MSPLKLHQILSFQFLNDELDCIQQHFATFFIVYDHLEFTWRPSDHPYSRRTLLAMMIVEYKIKYNLLEL